MLISCPNCTTRYDVDDERFSPDGRSVRCAECEESWFVPAPEPIEDLVPLNARSRVADGDRKRFASRDEFGDRDHQAHGSQDDRLFGHDEYHDGPEPPRKSMKFRLVGIQDDEDARPHAKKIFDTPDSMSSYDEKESFVGAKGKNSNTDDVAYEEFGDDDDVLFARHREPREDQKSEWRDPRDGARANADHRSNSSGRDRYDGTDRDFEDRPPHYNDRGFARRSAREDGYDDARHASGRQGSGRDRGGNQKYDRGAFRDDPRSQRRDPRDATVVDADFVALDSGRDDGDDFEFERGFGRKVRAGRRRSTALARIDELAPVAERVFNDEFFAALNVQPRELERAIRRARRKAESRQKNRITPLRALGWTLWIGVVTISLFAVFAYRDNIVAMFPNTASAYQAVGLEADPPVLKIEGVSHRLAMSTQGPTLEIVGRLRNASPAAMSAPLLQAEALDRNGDLLSRWTFEAHASEVGPDQTVDFFTRAAAPDGVREVTLSFAPAEGARVSIGTHQSDGQ